MASLARRLLAEAVGTFGLIFAGCGVVVLAGCKPDTAADLLCIALAFGLAAYAMARAVGPISGAHLNPAISLGLAAARRFPWREVIPYGIAQLVGAVAAATLLMLAAQGRPDFAFSSERFAANGYGLHSPAGYDLPSALAIEFAATAMLALVTASVTHRCRLIAAGPVVLGLALAMAHLLALPVTHAALNPARATGQALFVQGWAMAQLWLFWLAPVAGGLMGGLVAFCLLDEDGLLTEPDELTALAQWAAAEAAEPGCDPPPPA